MMIGNGKAIGGETVSIPGIVASFHKSPNIFSVENNPVTGAVNGL